ncbi:MAG: CgeB family protein [Planctomycetota bacterium]
MKVVMFYHSLLSDWNHGNAHFLRGVVSELLARGHRVDVYEPTDSWSRQNLLDEQGAAAIRRFHRAYPHLQSIRYDAGRLDLDRALHNADLVIVHEWNEPALVARIGRHRSQAGRYRLLFHDTHHRSVTAPKQMRQYDLTRYDGVLAFGQVVHDIYLRNNWARRAWVWHEAADTRIFRPRRSERREGHVVWVGNWGDEERTEELQEFLLDPVHRLRLTADVYGVRYHPLARQRLERAGVRYHGWLANFDVPKVFSRFGMTVHVPRRPYVESLPGIPTIRPFEAMACGTPLICSPWDDAEGLFTPGEDYLIARDGEEMACHMRTLLDRPPHARRLAAHALQTIRARHTCSHRVDELMGICRELEIDCGDRPARVTVPSYLEDLRR